MEEPKDIASADPSGQAGASSQAKEQSGGGSPDPRRLLAKIEVFTEQVGSTFQTILGSLDKLQDDIKELEQLKQVASVAESMLAGKQTEHLQVEAKGEVGKLARAINQTLDKLQQLDQSIQNETGKVPELAAHLDHIAEETETATQQVLEKLDQMIEGSEQQTNALHEIKTLSEERVKFDREAKKGIDDFLAALENDGDQAHVLQEAMEFVALMGEQARIHLEKSEAVNVAIDNANEQAETLMNNSFDIMNLLQFQDITRQKVSKVINLLKEMQSGLYRLLEIFNIVPASDPELHQVEGKVATQDRILERDAITKDEYVESVDDIIRSFQNS